jgi:hypothetical protein
MGVDLYWERLHLHYSAQMHNFWEDFRESDGRSERNNRGHIRLVPGEITHADGGIQDAFRDFMRDQGYKLSKVEERSGTELHSQKYCVVLNRRENDEYVICLVSTFGSSQTFNETTSPVARFFGVPFRQEGDDNDAESIAVYPPWKVRNYIFAAPVIRKEVRRNVTARRLGAGELDRLRAIVASKVKVGRQPLELENDDHQSFHSGRRSIKITRRFGRNNPIGSPGTWTIAELKEQWPIAMEDPPVRSNLSTQVSRAPPTPRVH